MQSRQVRGVGQLIAEHGRREPAGESVALAGVVAADDVHLAIAGRVREQRVAAVPEPRLWPRAPR